ncbi:C1 family peptidase [Polyangium jinanense]|uniref:TerB family tellurite resistance protein n=1 Tax=Polyangium jinanense TaxID=2829994 RepID=A0A9X3XEE9_9BACT|nr:C1 family peptidase [Polyangium jinanense]MDC3961439.1 TerB family tellurite resistance protein [Polyangium jinanense]MDC3987870.1 TerB family tellurite resistance protein [Polyangium jinanense]
MNTFNFTQADGSSRAVVGYRYAPPKAAAKRYVAGRGNVSRLPPKVDLRPFMSPIEDQKATNSCAANATAGAYEYLVKRHLGEDAYDVSRLFIYYNGRAVDDPENIQDEGSVLQSVIASLKEHGACSEETWAFDPEAVNEQPSDEAYQEAAQFRIEDTELVPTNLEAWKMALAEGHPIIFGVKLFSSFDKHKKAGLVPVPTSRETGRESHGGHAMLCVGYSDPDQVFIVRNSWGPEWGDKGYCYIPYRYLMNEEYNFGDSWIIKRIDVLPPDEETWSDDEESVLEDVSSVLAQLDEDEYAGLLESMGDVPLDVRLALLFLRAAGADGDIADDELRATAEHITPVLEQLGSRQSAEKVLRNALRRLDDEQLVEETIEVLGEVFSQEVLASIASQLQEIVGSDDDVSEEEQAFVDAVVERWQIEPAEDEGDEEEGDEDEGDEDEGDEEEGDEDEEEEDE